MTIGKHIIGVCSWSLNPSGMTDLIGKVKTLGLSHLQLNLSWLLKFDAATRADAIDQLRESGLSITAGMVTFDGEDYASIAMIKQTGGFVPDAAWEKRRDFTRDAAKLARTLGITKVSAHAGFVPNSSDPHYKAVCDRVNEVARVCGEQGVDLLMETGQEAASDLLQFLNDVPQNNLHINFDPANMILYGAGDPVEAIATVERHISHVHIKDATHSQHPGSEWGAEVPFGTGDVPVGDFLGALHGVGYYGPLVIEREAGNQRMDDVKIAIETLENALRE